MFEEEQRTVGLTLKSLKFGEMWWNLGGFIFFEGAAVGERLWDRGALHFYKAFSERVTLSDVTRQGCPWILTFIFCKEDTEGQTQVFPREPRQNDTVQKHRERNEAHKQVASCKRILPVSRWMIDRYPRSPTCRLTLESTVRTFMWDGCSLDSGLGLRLPCQINLWSSPFTTERRLMRSKVSALQSLMICKLWLKKRLTFQRPCVLDHKHYLYLFFYFELSGFWIQVKNLVWKEWMRPVLRFSVRFLNFREFCAFGRNTTKAEGKSHKWRRNDSWR